MLHVDWIETQPGYNNPDPFYKNYFATPPAVSLYSPFSTPIIILRIILSI